MSREIANFDFRKVNGQNYTKKLSSNDHFLTFRLFQTHPNIQDTFPSFKGVTLDEMMNSRSLYLHAKRVMAAVEQTICSLDDAEVLIETLTKLGRRHQPWSINEEHFKVNTFIVVSIRSTSELIKTKYVGDNHYLTSVAWDNVSPGFLGQSSHHLPVRESDHHLEYCKLILICF